MVCIKLHSSEAAISVRGTDVAVAATVDHVIPEEHGNVNLDKFHDRFLNLNRGTCAVGGSTYELWSVRVLGGLRCREWCTGKAASQDRKGTF